jgi:serine protease DegQ
MQQIIQTGSVTRGWVGVEVDDLSPELAESFKLPDAKGVLIAGVVRGGPADRAGVRPGDVLVEVDGTAVPNPSSMLNVIAAVQPGSVARLKLLRNGNPMELKLTVGKRPKPQHLRE